MQITIAKFHLYPQEDPNGYAVGFNVTASNGRSFYTDTIIPLTETQGKTDDQIVSMAYEQLQQGITDRVTTLEQRSPILGTGWTPPDDRLPDDPETPFDPEDLEALKNIVKRKFELQTQRFIETLPNGNDRYKWFHGITLVNTKFSLLSIPVEHRTQEINDAIDAIFLVEAWQADVFGYFNIAVQDALAAETEEILRSVENSFDLEQFNIMDPDISLDQIMVF